MGIKTVGLPAINNVDGEKRAFLPSFVKKINNYDVKILIEKDYGKKMGFTEEDYIKENPKVTFVNREEVFKTDLVIILKAPDNKDIKLMNKNAGLISMLHYGTREESTNLLKEKGINSYSMDSIVDDKNKRLVVTYEKTAEGGVFVTINEMEKRWNDFYSNNREPYNIVILGMGNLGVAAGKSFFRYFHEKVKNNKGIGNVSESIITYIEKDSINNKNDREKIFNKTDVFIDATKRRDFSEYIITNDLIASFKGKTIILDLTADPYDIFVKPMQVKAIEGIPTGNLNKYIFEVDDEEYNNIPSKVKTDNRRLVISCSGWPGIFPKSTMKIYEQELEPFLNILFEKGMEISIHSNNLYERALYRSTIKYFEKENK